MSMGAMRALYFYTSKIIEINTGIVTSPQPALSGKALYTFVTSIRELGMLVLT